VEPLIQTNLFADRTFLVIDDFGEMRNMIKGMLRLLGAREIDSARDAKEALVLIGRARYDVILCDYNLGPGKNGQQLFEELRHKQLIDQSTVFVMITAENTRDMVMAVVEYEPDSYLTKPFTKDLLGTRLKKLFEHKADLSPVFKALRLFKYREALQLIDERIAQSPKNLSHLIRLKAETCLQAEQYEVARKIYQDQLNERDFPWARMGLGRVQFKEKQFHDAADNFNHLVRNHKTLMSAHDWLAQSQLAMGFPKDAQATLSNALRLSPQVMNRQQKLGEVAMQNQDYEVAESALSKAVNLSKQSVYNNPELHANLAKSMSANGKHDEALEVINRIGSTFDDPLASFYADTAEAQIRQRKGDEAGAHAAMDRAEQLFRSLGHSAPPETSLELARAAASMNQAERAQEILRKAILNNHDNEALLSKATAVIQEVGISEDATALVHSLRQQVVAMNNKGVKLLASGRFSEAVALFVEAAESMSGNLVINLNAARALIMQMEKQGVESELLGSARRFLEISKEIAPDDRRLHSALERYQKLSRVS
jgi:tetratricopeptide (TPR) repeat protein